MLLKSHLDVQQTHLSLLNKSSSFATPRNCSKDLPSESYPISRKILKSSIFHFLKTKIIKKLQKNFFSDIFSETSWRQNFHFFEEMILIILFLLLFLFFEKKTSYRFQILFVFTFFLSDHSSICVNAYLSFCLPAYLSICVCVSLSACLFVH